MKPTRYILEPDNPYRDTIKVNVLAFVERLPVNKSWEIEIRLYHPTRSDKQRKSLFGVAYKAIMEATGLQGSREKDQLHTNMCGEFFGWKDVPMIGRVPVRTTTINEHGERDEITTLVALEMYEFIQRIASDYGIDVPDPDPLWREHQQEAA